MARRCWLFILVLFSASICAEEFKWQHSQAITKLFQDAELTGTFVLYDPQTQTYSGHNLARAQQRYLPASTFKIPNTLISLAAGSVKNVDEVLPYGGKLQPFPSWEKDMSLRDAIGISNVPVYQELARRTGIKTMREHITKLSYGNGEIGETVDNFWLIGPLKISALEQTQFLAKLAQNQLSYPVENQTAVKDIALLESTATWRLHGKTGWANATTPGIGWWVGWVEKDGRVYSFALNVDVHGDADVKKRVPIGRESLKVLGVL
ncbi:MAG: class D beta-lactamase [Cellvibrionaceae bacterium]|nr:class D beta-lactamase [Cellvibrionaceae bacterium]